MQFFETLKRRLFSRNPDPNKESTIEGIINKGLGRIRQVDPQTKKQWLSLQAAMVEVQPMVKSRSVPRLVFATFAVVMSMLGGYLYFALLEPSPETFSTQRGQQKEIVLNDGSHVTLNYETELVVSGLRPDEPRRLFLTGEAFFRVEKKSTPFIVSTDYAEVQVVGTEFNVRARQGGIDVAVIRGSVKVTAVRSGKESSLMLSENQMAMCSQDGFPIRMGDVPSPEFPGWTRGKLFLNKTALIVACREIEMRFDVIISLQNAGLGNERITGVLGAGTAESGVRALCELTGRRFRHEGNAYTIY